MRIQHIGVLGFLAALVVLWPGCSGDPICAKSAGDAQVHRPSELGESCAHDPDCKSGFCDRGKCNDPDSRYGHRCAPLPPNADPVLKLPESICLGYLCMDGLCRSCLSDAECHSFLGAGKCTLVADAPGWPTRSVCDPPTARRRRGSACTEDAQCWTLFCDRGVCENSSWPVNYGAECTPGSPAPPVDDPRTTAGGPCEGYLCVNGRCRSCQSDEECQGGTSGLKCLAYGNWPKKVCVTPEEASKNPYLVVSKAPIPDLEHGGPRTTPPRVPAAPRPPPRCR